MTWNESKRRLAIGVLEVLRVVVAALAGFFGGNGL